MQELDDERNLSIELRLKLYGINHVRDEQSEKDGKHRLYNGEQYLGRFDALEANNLLVEIAKEANK